MRVSDTYDWDYNLTYTAAICFQLGGQKQDYEPLTST